MTLDDVAARTPSLLQFTEHSDRSLTHRMFRYPAKFHVPVAAGLIEQFSTPGQTILDPFCGSGTILVEASVRGRSSVGTDLDPLAVAVSRAKTSSFPPGQLESVTERLQTCLATLRRPDSEYLALAKSDLTDDDYRRALDGLWVPAIPRLRHWFRNYVIIDLARIRSQILKLELAPAIERWIMVVFASIIRNASNADPVPVSGLEVTAHMRRLDAAGRVINPFALLDKALGRAVRGATAYASERSPATSTSVFQSDATTLQTPTQPDVIITSPPYQNAVDYYRRHQLEMFWLDLTSTQADRLALQPSYIGKHRVAASNPILKAPWAPSPTAQEWLDRMQEQAPPRARDFRAYMTSMDAVFARWADLLPAGGLAVCVVGRSTWNGANIPTDELFLEMAQGRFSMLDHLSYPVKNRYMSYARRNGADIAEEHVLVLEALPPDALP
ncbi:DNA methyltransferase [Microbacterium sp. 22296]|uniref:DNA methyltransferase n=1 Tax=Microbacterium sp. 22296 TaxID=3453903 RepID=UPI003F84D947